MRLDGIDGKLLERLQQGVPLVRRPFQALGRELGILDSLDRVRRLKEEGLIREIAGVFQARALGYRTALVALKVAPAGLEAAAAAINPHPGVSHNYAREHEYNLWFTLALPLAQDLRAEALRLGEKAGAEDTLFLPTLRVFKIGVLFSPSSFRSRRSWQ
jgi:DNA-binding Lrp family transcriptional regulator